MEEVKLSLTLEADNGKMARELRASEKALRDQAKAIDATRRENERRLLTLKQDAKANEEQIRALQRQNRELRLNAQETKAQIAAIKEKSQALQQSNRELTQYAGELGRLIPIFNGLTGRIAAFGAAVAITGKSLQTFGNFERTLNTIKAVSGATASELKDIAKSSEDLGASTVFNLQQVADSYLNLAKAGFTAKESLEAMPGILDAAAASGDDLAQTSEIVTGTLRGFGLQAVESGRVADVLAQSANVSAANISDLGQGLKQLGPIALSSGQNLEDMAAILSVLSNRMINGADAGTDLRGILTRLVNPPADAAKALSALGVSIADQNGKIRPFIDVVVDLQKALEQFDEASRNRLLSDIAGLENLKTLATLANASEGELRDLQKRMNEADGAARKMANTINQGVNTAVDELGGSVQTLSKDLGEALAPAFVAVVNSLTDFVNVTRDGLQPIFDMTSAVSGLAGRLLQLRDAAVKARAASERQQMEDYYTGLDRLNLPDWLKPFFDNRPAFNGVPYEFGEDPGNPLANALKDFNSKDSIVLSGGGKRTYNPNENKKKTRQGPKGPRPETLENRRFARLSRGLNDSLQDINLFSRQSLASLPAGSSQASEEQVQADRIRRSLSALNSAYNQVNATAARTVEGAETKAQALRDIQQQIKGLVIEQAELQKRQEERGIQLVQQAEQLYGEEAISQLQNFADIQSALEEAQLRDFEDKYRRREITAQEYYKAVETAAFQAYQRESDILEQQIANLQAQKARLTPAQLEAGQGAVTDQQISDLRRRQGQLGVRFAGTLTQAAAEQNAEINSFAEGLSQGVRNALEEAIRGAFTGQGIGAVLKQFADSIRNVFVSAFANALSQRLTKVFNDLFSNIGKTLSNIANGTGKLSDLFKGDSGKAIVGGLGFGLVGAAASGSLPGGRIGGALGGALGGAAAGAAIGGPIGAGIGLLAGGIAGLFGGGSGRKQRREQAAIEDAQRRVTAILDTANADDLNQLKATRTRIGRAAKKAPQGQPQRVFQDAVRQVNSLIKQRRQVILDGIDSIRADNRAVEQELQLNQAEPFQRAALERQFALENLRRDTEKALKQFKDSQTLQTEILKNEALKRKAIEEDLKLQYEDSARTLEDLLKQRDAVSNANVFTRSQSAEQAKAEQLTELDRQIGAALLTVKNFSELGLGDPRLAGFNQLLGGARQAGIYQNAIEIVINDARDPNKVSEEVTRALDAYFRKLTGANAA